MTKYIQHPIGRRLFVQRVTGLAAGAGALMAGLFPETSARAAVAVACEAPTATADTATPAATASGGEPPSSPLTLQQQNQLYSAALNDATLAQLLSSAGIQGRIDPPLEHSQVAFSPTRVAQTVVLPVASYATGQRIAVLTYGIDVASPASPPLRAVILSSGELKLSLNGTVHDSPKPEWKDAYQLRYFPDQYFAKPIRTSMATPMQSSSRLLARWQRAVSGALLKTRYAGDDDNGTDPRLQDCYDNCFNVYKSTASTILLTLGVGAFVISFWCILCIMAILGCTTVTGPLVIGVVADKCAYACLFAMGAIAGLLLALENARTQSILCDKNCDLQFGPKPKPAPGPVA